MAEWDVRPSNQTNDAREHGPSGQAGPAYGPASHRIQPTAAPAPGPPPPDKGSPEEDALPPAMELRFDWLTEVLIPAAVFGLLASFFYYLIDLRGAVGDPGLSGLRWVCFWFLLGTILTTRMRTRYGAHILALPYMLGLALAVCLFIFHFTMYSGAFVGTADLTGQVVALIFNYALVGIIWWVASVVTRACTAEENFMTMTDGGLMSNLRRPRPRSGRRRDRQPRHPGWVLMWTSLVALVTFALGQHVMGGTSQPHRAHAFMCMVSYSFFALLLLALTSLSAMRISARRRRIKVASSITPAWAIASTLIITAILLMAAALPRMKIAERMSQRIAQLPGGWREPPETPWTSAPPWGGRRPREDPGGRRRADEDSGSQRGAEGEDTGRYLESGDEESRTPTGGPGGPESGTPEAGGTGTEGNQSATTGGAEGSQGGGARGESGEADQEGSQFREDSSERGDLDEEETPSESGGTRDKGRGDQEREAEVSSAGTGDQPSRPTEVGRARNMAGVVDLLKQLLLWLLIMLGLLLLLLLIAYLIYRLIKNRKQLPSFRTWLASLWLLSKEAVRDTWLRVVAALARAWAFILGLLGWRPRLPKLGPDGLPEDPFTDIFANRELAESLSPAQVVRHVYAAFQAFADLIGHPRSDQQTPYEFLRALPSYIGGMPRNDADDLTALYVKAAYSPEEVGEQEVARVREIWEHMQGPIDEALAKRKKPGRAPSKAA